MAISFDQAYVKARKSLLDALDALGPHRQAVILIGAQAIYVRTGEVEFAVPPFTYDADLAIDPRGLAGEPKIIEVMRLAGFSTTEQPGLYRKADGSQVDLLVPEALGGPGRRGARLGTQGNKAAMKVHGIEGALVDHSPKNITSLDINDSRSHVIKVAGPAALLVAKLFKVAERAHEDIRRRDNKDAFDIYRLLRAIDTANLAAGLVRLHENMISTVVTTEALSYFKEYFGDPEALGTRMVVEHIEGLEPEDFISASCVALSQDLFKAINLAK